MITKSIIITMFLFSVSGMPMHSENMAQTVKPVENPGVAINAYIQPIEQPKINPIEKTTTPAQTIAPIKKNELKKSIEAVKADLPAKARRVTLNAGKTEEQCMQETFNSLYAQINPQLQKTQKIPEVEMAIEL